MSAPAPDLATGDVFAGRYQIIEEIGRGGMGRVYKVFDTKIQERVALKIIAPEIAADPRVLARFHQELKLARQVTHKNVCRVFDIGESEGVPYITMELCPGDTLHGILAKTGALNIRTAVDYARQIGEGLAEAHKLGIVHRDLKSRNLIIDESHQLRIMDFGIARPVGGEFQTRENVIIGTPEYMAPEQVEGAAVDPRTDIYALGVVLYEMVTGHPPFEGDSTLSIALKQKNEAARPPAEENPLVPAALNALILKCLEKDRTRRFPDAAAVIAELDRIARDLGPTGYSRSGRRPTTGPISLFPPRRKRTVILGATVVLAVAVAAFLLVTRPSGRDLSPASATPDWSNRLAVLTLEDASPKRDQGIFCDGMTDDLRAKLSRATTLTVISYLSSDVYKEKKIDLRQIGQTLNAKYIVSGRVDVQAEQLAVSIVLGDAESAASLKTWTYKGRLADHFALEDDMVRDITRQLDVRLSQENLRKVKTRETRSFEAERDYLRGRQYEKDYRLEFLPEDFDKAEAAYKEALSHDRGYALAYHGLGDLYEARFVQKSSGTDLGIMMRHYQAAYNANPNLPEALGGMGWLSVYQSDLDRAAGYYQSAYRLAPQNIRVTLGIGALLRTIGLYDKALKYLGESMMIEPLDENPAIQYALSGAYLGRFETALETMKEARKFPSPSSRVNFFLVRINLMAQKYEEAETWMKNAGDIEALPENLRRGYEQSQIVLCAWKGETNQMTQLIRSAARPFAYEITNAYCLTGLFPQALTNIKDGIRLGFEVTKDYMYTYLYLLHNPYFEGLRKNPEFLTILAEAKANYDLLMKKYDGF
jgi:serine/threonine protein kinase/tetratricopeptide (TPR) repeat protein